MMQKVRAVLDDGFLVGLVFALFLAGKIVPYLVVVGVIPIFLFWKQSDYVGAIHVVKRLLVPTLGYFAFCYLLLYLYPGIGPEQKPPRNPDFELYFVALLLLATGLLRGLQIKGLFVRFQTIVPLSLFAAFGVLSIYMFLGIDGCRVKVAAAWPFIPAIIFATLTFLVLMGWEFQSRSQRHLRLLLIALSIVVTLAYTGSRGVAVGQFAVLLGLLSLRCGPRFRKGLPTTGGFLLSIFGGLILSVIIGTATGCNGLDRWPALLSTAVQRAELQLPVATDLEGEQQRDARGDSINDSAFVPSTDTTYSSDTSISLRLHMWVVSVQAIRQAPWFGHGAMSLRTIIQDKFGFEHNHNQYLAWLVTGGIVFLAFGTLFVATPILISTELTAVDRAVLILSVTGLWGASMIFDAFLSLDFYLHYFSLLLGFLFCLIQSASKPQDHGRKRDNG